MSLGAPFRIQICEGSKPPPPPVVKAENIGDAAGEPTPLFAEHLRLNWGCVVLMTSA